MELQDQVLESTYYIRSRAGGDRLCVDWEAGSIFSATRLICKVLREPDESHDRERLSRFVDSLEQLIGLSNDGVERVVASGRHAGHSYFVLETLPAETLADFIGDPKTVSVQEALQIAIRVARALTFMHSRSIAHRHLHPGVVRVQANYDRISLLKISQYYLAAYEQLLGAPIPDLPPAPFAIPRKRSDAVEDAQRGFAADVYSFGVLLYWLMTGRREELPNNAAHGKRGISLSAANRQVPGVLDSIVSSCLGLVPDRRFPKMEKVLSDLILVASEFQRYLREKNRTIAAVEQPDPGAAANEAEPESSPPAPPRPEARPAPVLSRSRAEAISRLMSLDEHFSDVEREIHHFKQLFHDLYVPRGALHLIKRSNDRALREKQSWLAYFKQYITYSRGAVLTIPGAKTGKENDLLRGFTDALFRFWTALRASARRRFSSAFSEQFAPWRPDLIALTPNLAQAFGNGEAGQPGRRGKHKSGDERRAVLFDQLLRFMAERHAPLLVVLRRVESLDPFSLRLLAGSAASLADQPVLVVGFLD